MNIRRLRLGLATVLGIARRGFFIPYRYAGELPGPGERPRYRKIETLFSRHRDEFAATLAAIDEFAADLRAIGQDPPPAPRWQQDWFPRLDGAAAYALTRSRRPSRIVEIGSGHSTRFFCRAIADGGLKTTVTAIDPAPRALLAGLDVRLIRRPLHAAGNAAFAELAHGDFLAIDSSHVLMPASDVDQLVNHVIPELPAGVVIHIHDIFLPDDYPAEWSWRAYNEQLAVAALLHGGGFRPLFASHFAATRMGKKIAALEDLPHPPGAHESSLWMEKIR